MSGSGTAGAARPQISLGTLNFCLHCSSALDSEEPVNKEEISIMICLCIGKRMWSGLPCLAQACLDSGWQACESSTSPVSTGSPSSQTE